MISVVIPVRNRETLVARAIKSALSQTSAVNEVIVVDDASTDRTREAVNDIARSIDNVVLIPLKESVGAAKSRNIGLNAAKGHLIAFLDSDDIWFPQKIEKQLKELDANEHAVAAFCGVVIVSAGSKYRHEYIPKPIIGLDDLYYSSSLVTMSCALIRKTPLVDIGGFDPSLPSCQDWDLFIRLSARGQLHVVQEALVEFWRHDGERISRNRQSVLAGHKIVFDRIYKRISDPQVMRKVRASHEWRLADIFSADFFEPFRALRHACRSLVLAPSLAGLKHLELVLKVLAKRLVFGRI
jgi:glycosyltransferase involved in cell wall biosynthesis